MAISCLDWARALTKSPYSRFEFSMLAADGGFILPHTAAPEKIVTLVISMVREGEWDNQIGGSLVTCRPKESCHSFNHVNQFLELDEIEPLHAFENGVAALRVDARRRFIKDE